MISEATIELIKERANLVDLVGDAVALKRRGSGFLGLCPFHSEKTPSFHIRADGTFYHCFGCGASGNAITFLMQSRGLSFPEAVSELAGRLNIPIETVGGRVEQKDPRDKQRLFKLNMLAHKFFRSCLQKAPAVVCDYISSRGLDAEVLDYFGVGYAPDGRDTLVSFLRAHKVPDDLMVAGGLAKRGQSGELYDAFRARLIFPVFLDTRRICAFGGRIIPPLVDPAKINQIPKYLNSPETPIYQKSKVLYALPQALSAVRAEGELYLVEGYMDVAGLWKAGVRNAVATCGTAVTESHVKRLARLVKRLTVLFDGDAAGRAAASRCFELFSNSGIETAVVFLPAEHDPDSLAREHGQRTPQVLEAFPRRSLLESHLDSVLEKYGVSEARQLGAAAKGSICEGLAPVLSQVRNPVEQNELIRTAALNLGVDFASLLALVQGVGGKKLREKPQVADKHEVTAAEVSQAAHRKPVSALSAVDRQILSCAMVLKSELSQSILRDPDLCSSLDPVTLGFLESFNLVLSSQQVAEAAQKEAIKALLQGLGADWVSHWKSAYKMAEDPDVDFHKAFDECRRAARKIKLNQALSEIDRRIKESIEEEEKTLLSQEKLALSRALNSL